MIDERRLKAAFVAGAHLSGIRLPPKTRWPGRELTDVVFKNCRFESVVMGGVLARPIFRRCRFEGCDLSGLNARKVAWEGCRFVCVQFDGSFGSIRDSTFTDCTFENTTFGAMVFETSTFRGCEFSGVTIRKVSFNGSRFETCSFSGRFSSVNWVNCTTSAVDLEAVRMVDCSLVDSHDSDIRLPDNDGNFYATHDDFVTAAKLLKARLSPGSYQSFIDASEFVRGSSHGEILDTDFFEGISKNDARALLREFRAVLRSSSKGHDD